MGSLVPPAMASHFEAAKSARLLAVSNVDEAGAGWILLRLLGDWLRLCVPPSPDAKSDICILVLSFCRDFDFYASGLSQFGVDLKQHEARGHFKFIGGMYAKRLGSDPSVTLQETLELVCDEAAASRQHYARTVLLLDSPELVMTLAGDSPQEADAEWLMTIQDMIYQFHHAIVAVALDSPHMGSSRAEFLHMLPRVTAVKNLGYKADMAMVLRHYHTKNTKTDGTVRISYAASFEPANPSLSVDEETFGYRIAADGRTVTIGGSDL